MGLNKLFETTDFERNLFLEKENSELKKLLLKQNSKMLELAAERKLFDNRLQLKNNHIKNLKRIISEQKIELKQAWKILKKSI